MIKITNEQKRGMYVHIPFCQYICHYCDFVKQVPKNKEMVDKYLDYLVEEINLYESYINKLDTIYIGGGTPSMLSPFQMEKLFSTLVKFNAKDITIEINPDSYSLDKGLMFKKYGITRVSVGVQSFHDSILKYVNRQHNKEMVFYTVNSLRQLGIKDISVDLIYAIPGQTTEMLLEDLENINALNIDHVACYSLILEENTYFYHQFVNKKFHPVDNEIEGIMYKIVIDKLKEYGFTHYEISNFHKNGKYSRHNVLYWTLGEYIGVGLGAHGFVNNVRTYNHRSLNKYYQEYRVTETKQNKKDNIADFLIFGLRLIQGVNLKLFEEKFGESVFDLYPLLNEKIKDGLVEVSNDYLKLTEKGIPFGNKVFGVFV